MPTRREIVAGILRAAVQDILEIADRIEVGEVDAEGVASLTERRLRDVLPDAELTMQIYAEDEAVVVNCMFYDEPEEDR